VRRRLLAGAVPLGALAGALATIDVRLAGGVVVWAAALLLTTAFGVERLTEAGWLVAAILAPMNALRVTSFAALTDVVLVAAATGTIVTAIVVRRPIALRRPDRRLLTGLALIAISGLIGTVFAEHPEKSLLVMTKFVLAAAGSILVLALWSASADKLRRFCWAWLLGAVLSAAWAVSGHSPKIGGRPQGLATHPNHMGLVCVLGFGLTVGLASSTVGRQRLAAQVAVLPLVAGGLLSGSRAAVLGMIVVVPLWSVLSGRWALAWRFLLAGVVLVVALGLGLLHLPANNGATRLLGDRSSAESNAERVQDLQLSIDRFVRHPLTGEGFEFSQEAHNIYLQVLVAGGPVALLGLGLVVSSVLRPGLAIAGALRRARVSRNVLLPLGMVSGYVGYLVASMFQNVLWDRYLWLFIAAALSLMASAIQEHQTAGVGPLVPSRVDPGLRA
jgi:hypothetical protein